MEWNGRIWLALDGMNLTKALNFASKLKNRVGYKLNDLWDEAGAEGLVKLRTAGAEDLWVDAKLKDIPKTVANRVAKISAAGADFITVMADGEVDMMMAALKAAVESRRRDQTAVNIIAVTVLTSLAEEQAHLMYGQPSKAAALNLARLAKLAGIKFVVCSPQEVGTLAKRPELDMVYITPGVRPSGSDPAGQTRFDTPVNAIKAGADDLVIGSPITGASDPIAALDAIEAEITAA